MKKQSDEYFKKARDRFAAGQSAWSQVRTEFDKDLEMVNGDQWSTEDRQAREGTGRPCLQAPQLHVKVAGIVNNERQNKRAIKFSPVDSGADEDTAKVYEGIVRHYDYMSQANVARETAVDYAASGGWGMYRMTTVSAGDDTLDLDIAVEPIMDPNLVIPDPDCVKPDFSDMRWCHVSKDLPWDTYRTKYPEASTQEWDSSQFEGKRDWGNEKTIRVSEYWYIKEKIVHCDLINAFEVLESTTWPADEIPIFIITGKQTIVKGKRIFASAVRYARDSQRLLNAAKSGIAEAIGIQNRVPYLGPRGSFTSDKNWQTAHVTNPAYLEYDAVQGPNGETLPPPIRQTGEAAIQALSELALQSADDINKAVGYNDPTIQPSQQKDLSGVSILRRTQQTQLSTSHFSDNLTRTMVREGRMWLKVIPKIVDTAKAVQIMDQDGSISLAAVTQAIDGDVPLVPGMEEGADIKGHPNYHHRLDVGKYSVAVTTGPDYPTKRLEEFDMWAQLAPNVPGLWERAGDIIVRNSDVQGAEDIADRLKPQQGPNPALMGQQLQETQAELMQLKFEKAAKTQELQAKHQDTVEANTIKLLIAEIQSQSKESTLLVEQQFAAFGQMLQHTQELMLQHQAGVIAGDPSMQPPQPDPSETGVQQ